MRELRVGLRTQAVTLGYRYANSPNYLGTLYVIYIRSVKY